MTSAGVFERRLGNEWSLLQQLAARNPGRITNAAFDGSTIALQLHGAAALAVCHTGHPCLMTSHAIRIDYPVHFPAVPMEMFVAAPFVHPNVHPETGFVCLWDRHRVSNTVEHAMHKVVAMLAGTLENLDPAHVMQPPATGRRTARDPMPLLGVEYDASHASLDAPQTRRRLQ